MALLPVLVITDLFHPIDVLAVECFGDRDMRHRGNRSGAVPMLLARRKPDDVARPHFLDRCALALNPPETRGDNERLPERMGMPGGARTRLESHVSAGRARRFLRTKQGVDAHRAGEILGRSFGRWFR